MSALQAAEGEVQQSVRHNSIQLQQQPAAEKNPCGIFYLTAKKGVSMKAKHNRNLLFLWNGANIMGSIPALEIYIGHFLRCTSIPRGSRG
jgi:hypothetical protein